MSKKIISIVLAIITIFSCFSIVSFASTTNAEAKTLSHCSCPTTGDVRVLTIVVTFQGLEPVDNRSCKDIYNMIYSNTYDNSIKTEDIGTQKDSLRSFLYRQSIGQFRVVGDMNDIYDYTTKNYYTYYLSSNIGRFANYLAEEAIEEMNIDKSKYDSNNDGCIDATIVYLRNIRTTNENGKTESLCCSSTSYCLPATQSNLMNDKNETYLGFTAVVNNIDYKNEMLTDSNVTLYHEFFHTFGFSDVYENSGVNPYSNNSFDGDSFAATGSSTIHQTGVGGISAAHKIELGWVNPVEISYGEYRINSSTRDTNAYVIKVDNTHSFIVEYCSNSNETNKTYFDGKEKEVGVRVWKVEYKEETNNTDSWYCPWNYIICKVDDSSDTENTISKIENLVCKNKSINLSYTREYNYTYNKYGTIISRTPIDYTYSGFSILVKNTSSTYCDIKVYNANEKQEKEENIENNSEEKNSSSFLDVFKNFFKKISDFFKNLFK